MMKRALIPLMISVAGVATSQPKPAAPNRPPMTVTTLPGVKIAEAVPAVGTNRFYYATRDDELFMYDRASKSSTLVSRGKMSEIALSPKNDRIAFDRGTEGNAMDLHIWTLPLDAATGASAGPARRVSVSAGHAPQFSPDGQQIAFAAKDSAGKEHVAVVPASGGAERIVDKTPRMIELIQWSPDARTLFFGDWGAPGLSGATYRIPVAGGPATLVIKTGSNHPGLSPDGRLLVVTNEAYDSLVIMTPDGRQLGKLDWIGGADIGSWNGTTKLFAPHGVTPRRLRAYSLADSGTRPLTDSSTSVTQAHWSPDGRHIVLETAGSLALMNADGSNKRALARDAQALPNCLWSPDGRWISFAKSNNEATDLVALEVTTRKQVVLANNLKVIGMLDWTFAARWAPDSRSLFYTQFIDTISGRPLGTRFALHEATLAGTDRRLREITVYRNASINAPAFGDSTVEVGTQKGAHLIAPVRSGAPEITLLPESERGVSVPSFSPDGRRVAYRINPNARDNSAFSVIEVMRANGSDHTKLSIPFNAVGGLHNPMFLPDPHELLVAGQATRGGDLSFYIVSMDGTVLKKLLTTPMTNMAKTRGRVFFDYTLSPDGKTLLYITDEAPHSIFTDVDLSAYLKLAPAKKTP